MFVYRSCIRGLRTTQAKWHYQVEHKSKTWEIFLPDQLPDQVFRNFRRHIFTLASLQRCISPTCWVICCDCCSCSRLRLEGAETDTPTWGWPTLEGRVAVDMLWLGVSERVKRGEELWLGVMEREMRAAAEARNCCCWGLALMVDVLWRPNNKQTKNQLVFFSFCLPHQGFWAINW